MSVKYNITYPYKNWFATLITGALILTVIAAIKTQSYYTHIKEWLGNLGLVLMLMGLVSLSTFLIYLIFYFLLSRKNIAVKTAKVVLVSVSIFGIVVTIFILSGGIHTDGWG